MAARRLAAELKKFQNSAPGGATVELVGDDVAHWIVKLPGPASSPYEGHIYKIEINYTAKYPYEKPDVCFQPPIFHPNVDIETGAFCIGDWAPAVHTTDLISTALNILQKPNAGNAVNAEAGRLYAENQAEFNRKVKESVKSLP